MIPLTEALADFGTGRTGTEILDLFQTSYRLRTRLLGIFHACPRPDEVMDEYDTPERPERTFERYFSCNAWHEWAILGQSKRLNPELYDLLVTPVPRLPGEPVGVYEPKAVPPSHKYQMSPLSTPWGYALSRVLIEQFGRDENCSGARINEGLEILTEVIQMSQTPIELLANLAEIVTTRGQADPTEVLNHILAPGILNEENCRTMFREIVDMLKIKAPKLWSQYEKIAQSGGKFEELDILDVTKI